MSDSAAKQRTTMHVGPLGSTIHVIRADADTVAELAGVDWNRHFRRVCLDPARGLITLMSPSHPHEDLSTIFDDIVNVAGSILTRAAKNLGNLRLRGQGDPPGTGMEPDCAFYVGERARAYFKARREGQTAVETYVERVAPDLVVEVEIIHADEGKTERYRDIGVRELCRLYGRKGATDIEVEFFALDSEGPPRRLDTSVVLEGFTPDAVCEAVDGVRFAETDDERREAVARIVRRRQRMSLRVREKRESYPAQPVVRVSVAASDPSQAGTRCGVPMVEAREAISASPRSRPGNRCCDNTRSPGVPVPTRVRVPNCAPCRGCQ